MTEVNSNQYSDLFDGGDFVFTQNPEGAVVGGGYTIGSFFLQGGMPPMTTYNESPLLGGKVSTPFENLAVPAGLFYINMRVPKKNSDDSNDQHYKNHEMASDEMIDKLYSLIEVDKKRKRKTRKNIHVTDKHILDKNKTKTKTRKHK
jgi:hypothetical protein